MTQDRPANDSILQRYTGRRGDEATPSPTASADPGDATDDCGAFGWLRGGRERSLMFEVRRKNGNVAAFGYAWLHEATFDPSVGVTLAFGTRRIAIVGRNLNAEVRPGVRLFEGLLRHRVPYIQEADEATMMRAGDGDVVIERINVE